MISSVSKVKAELEEVAAQSIEKLMRWSEEKEKPSLREIEEKVLEIRQELSVKMVEGVIERQEEVRPVPGPKCPECEAEMHYKASHGKQVTSWVGELQIKRGYYYCDQCKRGLFPPGRAVRTDR